MPLNVKRRHAEYSNWRETANFLWLSYIGGQAFHDSSDPTFLDQYPSELSSIYTARRQRAFLTNHFAAAVDAYIAGVFRRDPVREPGDDTDGGGGDTALSSGVQAFIDDATGDGTDLNRFSRDVATFALASERAFVGVDIRPDGLPYAHRIHPANLLDFSDNPVTREINWAIVAEEVITDDDPFQDRTTKKRYRLWLPNEWHLFDEWGNEEDEGRNDAGRVPIIAVDGTRVSLPVYDIALINKRIYNHCSQLDEIFINVTFPTLYYSGAEGAMDASGESVSEVNDTRPLVLGPTRALELPSDKDLNVMAPGYLVPPDGPARLLMEERGRLADTIRSLAGLERKDPDAVAPQSGVAKAYDFRETNERFVSLAQLIEEAEQEMFALLEEYGVTGASAVNVTYNKDFQVKDFQMLTDTYEKLQNFKLPPLVKKRAALDYSMVIAEEATEDEKKEIRDAVENMTEFDVDPAAATNGAGPPVEGNGAATAGTRPGPRVADILAGAVGTPGTPTGTVTATPAAREQRQQRFIVGPNDLQAAP